MLRSRRIALAVTVLLAGCATDVTGTAPTQGDVVDLRTINVFQARVGRGVFGGRPTGPVYSAHPECDDGRCIDLRFQSPVCRADASGVELVTPADFRLIVVRVDESGGEDEVQIICGDEIFDKVLLSSSATPRPYADPSQLAAAGLSNCAGPADLRLDTVSLHLNTSLSAVLALAPAVGFQEGRTEVIVQVGGPQSTLCPAGDGVLLVDEQFMPGGPINCDLSVQPPVCDFTTSVTYAPIPATPGIATSFTIDDPRHGDAPFFIESTLRQRSEAPDGLLVSGECPDAVCSAGTWSTTRYFPPHGRARARFAQNADAPSTCTNPDGSSRPCEREPQTIGVMVEAGGRTFFSPQDLVDRSAPVWLVDGRGMIFDPPSCVGGIGGRAQCLAMELVPAGTPTGLPLPMGLHIRSLEVVADDTLTFVGDPMRFEVPPATQSRQGEDFDRGRYGDGLGELTISLVTIDAPRVVAPFGSASPVQIQFHTDASGAPFASRVELRFGTSAGASVQVSSDRVVMSITSGTEFDVETTLEAHAWDAADRYLGYDTVPLTMGGERGAPPPRTGRDLEPGGDLDGDDLSNRDEDAHRTSPALRDSDADGVDDDDEVARPDELNPLSPDSDGDGVLDGAELDADANRDGVADHLDPNNETVGLDPQGDVILVEEEWTTSFDYTVEAEESAGVPIPSRWDVSSEVTFRITHALTLRTDEGDGNWLSEDAPGMEPAHTPPWDVVYDGVRLESIGVPVVSAVTAETDQCQCIQGPCLGEGSIIGQQCDLVPVQMRTAMRGASWPEHIGWFFPRDTTTVEVDDGAGGTRSVENARVEVTTLPGGTSAVYHVEMLPGDGLPDGGLTPLAGWGELDDTLGMAAHYGGHDPHGALEPETNGRVLLIDSLARSETRSTFGGPAFVLCSRAPHPSAPSGEGSAPTGAPGRTSADECVRLHIAGNGLPDFSGSGSTVTDWEFARSFPALDLGFFGGIQSRGATAVQGATYAVEGPDLLALMRGEPIDITQEGTTTGIPPGGSIARLAVTNPPAFLAQTVGGRAALRRLRRSVRSRQAPMSIVFEPGDARSTYDLELSRRSAAVEGTDTHWNGRVGHRSSQRGATGLNAENAASADWFRVHAALPQPSDTRTATMLEEVMRQCRNARATGLSRSGRPLPASADAARSCSAHLRVQFETPARYNATTGERCQPPSMTSGGPWPVIRGATTFECVSEIRGPRTGVAQEGVLLSQDVFVDHLWRPMGRIEPAEQRGGVLLRWTGQPETSNTLNRLPGVGEMQSQYAQIAGCARFPMLAPPLDPAAVTDGTTVSPGSYVLRGVLAAASHRPQGMADNSYNCSSPLGPLVDPLPRVTGARRRSRRGTLHEAWVGYVVFAGLEPHVGLPNEEMALALAMHHPAMGTPGARRTDAEVRAVTNGLRRELETFYEDLGVGVDVLWSDNAFIANSLPPFGRLNLALSNSGSGTPFCSVIRIDGDSGGTGDLGGRAHLQNRLGYLNEAGGCVFDNTVEFAAANACGVERAWIDHTGSIGPCPAPSYCAENRRFFPGMEALAPSTRVWTTIEAELYGAAIASHPMHELGHILGLDHVAIRSAQGLLCDREESRPDCTIRDSLLCRHSGVGSSLFNQIQLGLGNTFHPMLTEEGAGPVVPTAPGTCANINATQLVPPGLYRMNVANLSPTTPPATRRTLRADVLAEPPDRGGRTLQREIITCPVFGTGTSSRVPRFEARQASEAFLRQQYGPHP